MEFFTTFVSLFVYRLILQKLSTLGEKNFGRSLWFYVSLSDIRYTTTTSDAHIPRNISLFVTIRQFIIFRMSRSFIWDIEITHLIIGYGETDSWLKFPWTELCHHIQKFYRNKLKLPSSQKYISTIKYVKSVFFKKKEGMWYIKRLINMYIYIQRVR